VPEVEGLGQPLIRLKAMWQNLTRYELFSLVLSVVLSNVVSWQELYNQWGSERVLK